MQLIKRHTGKITTTRLRPIVWRGLWGAAAALLLLSPLGEALAQTPFIPRLIETSTIPANGDVNPYGVAFVPPGFPGGSSIATGDILISNFNNNQNQQGTGTTIVSVRTSNGVSPSGTAPVFFQGSPGLGLTTALGVLARGFVIVGNLPTIDGTSATIQPGSLLFLDRNGHLLSTYTNLNSPWDLALVDNLTTATLFVSNVLDGTVHRLALAVGPLSVTVTSSTQIASGYQHRTDPAALVIGPTGLVFNPQLHTLFVASTGDNAIYEIAEADTIGTTSGKGTMIFQDPHLRGPLGLVMASNGDLLAANGDAVNPDPTQPSEIVEFTLGGQFVAQYNVDAAQGAAFGMAISPRTNATVRFAAVDDGTNELAIYTVPLLP